MKNETESELCERWENWCAAQGMKCLSADDFLAEYWDILTKEQRKYVENFIETWDALFR